jgi:hypothetical protein
LGWFFVNLSHSFIFITGHQTKNRFVAALHFTLFSASNFIRTSLIVFIHFNIHPIQFHPRSPPTPYFQQTCVSQNVSSKFSSSNQSVLKVSFLSGSS